MTFQNAICILLFLVVPFIESRDRAVSSENDYLIIHHQEIYDFDEFYKSYFNLDIGDGEPRNEHNLLVGYVKPNSTCYNEVINAVPLRASQRVSGIDGHKSITVIADNIPDFIINDSEHGGECGKVIFYSLESLIHQYKDETTNFDNQHLIAWIGEQLHVSNLQFVNHFDFPVAVYWMDDAKEASLNGKILIAC